MNSENDASSRFSICCRWIGLALRLYVFGLLCNLKCSYRPKSSQIKNLPALYSFFKKTQISFYYITFQKSRNINLLFEFESGNGRFLQHPTELLKKSLCPRSFCGRTNSQCATRYFFHARGICSSTMCTASDLC